MPPISPRSAMRQKMRLAFVSDLAPGRSTLPQAFGAALLVAAIAGLAVILRILGFEEPASDRAILLVLIAAAGGFAAMLCVAVLALWIAEGWNRWLRAVLGGIGVGGLFIPATLFVFALKIRVIDGRIEADSVSDLRLVEIAWSMFGAMGMFTPTGLRYLAPLPVIAVVAMAALILFFWPRPALAD
jgi:hypothetical protein